MSTMGHIRRISLRAGAALFVGLLIATGAAATASAAPGAVNAVSVSATTAGTSAVGVATNIRGTATGAPHSPVAIQVMLNGKWSTSRYGTTDAKGAYTIPLTYAADRPGTHTYRALVTANATTYASPAVTLTRTATVRLDPRCYTKGVVVCASKKDRKVYYVDKGRIVKTLDARFGGRAYDTRGRQRMYSTREGSFTITRKIRDEVSYAYGNEPMPFSSYFHGGQAFHYSSGFARTGWVGDWGSHGCINLRSWSGAQWLFNNVRPGTRVVVYN